MILRQDGCLPGFEDGVGLRVGQAGNAARQRICQPAGRGVATGQVGTEFFRHDRDLGVVGVRDQILLRRNQFRCVLDAVKSARGPCPEALRRNLRRHVITDPLPLIRALTF